MKQLFALNTLVVLIVAVCLVASNAIAQTQYLKAGTKALQFQIQNDFLLRSFDGSTISLKKQKSSDRAYRLGLTLSADISDRDESQTSISGLSNGIDEDLNSQNIQLSLQKLFYTTAANRAYAYFGIGPTGRLLRQHRDRTTTNSSGDTSTNKSLSRTWSAGILGSIGVEWFAHHNISLLAEYNTAATISWLKNKSETISSTGGGGVQESDRTTYSLNDNGVRFGLAVYF